MSQIATSFITTKMSVELIERNYPTLIFDIRGYKVMIDSDLPSLYGVTTRRLKEQVKRNRERFPEDFMFELSKEEKELIVSTNSRLLNVKFSRVNPLVFTEHGVAQYLLEQIDALHQKKIKIKSIGFKIGKNKK